MTRPVEPSESDYDPQAASISSAYVSAFNDYVAQGAELRRGQAFNLTPLSAQVELPAPAARRHQARGRGAANVMPDLANAMKQNRS